MKRILVASDLSARSDRAVERAIQLAVQHEASLKLIHVVDDEQPEEITQSIKTKAGEKLSSLVTDVPTGLEIEVKAGQSSSSIVQEAADYKADLIVLGIHRNAYEHSPIIGSTMGRVVRECAVPVLVVMRQADDPYRKAIVGVDFSKFTELVLAAAQVFVPVGDIGLVHVYHLPFSGFLSQSGSANELRDTLQRDLSDLIHRPRAGGTSTTAGHGARFQANLIEGEVTAVLRDQVNNMDADLLVLGSNGRSGLTRVWLGSVAEHFLVHPPCDVLVVKE